VWKTRVRNAAPEQRVVAVVGLRGKKYPGRRRGVPWSGGADGTGGDAVGTDDAEGHGSQIAVEESAGEGLAEAGGDFDGFHGAETADGSGDGAEDGELTFPVRRRFRVEAGEAGAGAGEDGGQLGFEFEHGTFHERFALPHGFAVHEIAFLEKRGTIDDEIGLADEGFCIGWRDVLGDGHYFQARVEFFETAFDGFDAGFAEPIVGHEELAVEVARFEIAGVGDDEFTETGCGQFECDGAADSPATGDQS